MEPQEPQVGTAASPAIPRPAMPVGQSFGAMPQPASTTAGTSVPSLAEDNDLIETEWVNAMKQTMARHRHDPYALSQAMTALREDYLMKRYGKHIEDAK